MADVPAKKVQVSLISIIHVGRPYVVTFSGLVSVCLLSRLDSSVHKKLAKIFLPWRGVGVEKGEMFFSI